MTATLVPLYNGQGSFSFGGPTLGPGMSGVSYADRHLQNIGHTTATTTYYYHGDQIGSSRLMTSPFGEPVWNATYLPYGEEYNPEITVNNRKFTGKEHDTESGLDYFGARYYGSALGRFITPDWAAKAAAVPYAEFADPQSFNLYTYVRNIPTVKADLDGHDGCCDTDIKVDMEMVKQTLQQLGPAAGPAIGAAGPIGVSALVIGAPFVVTYELVSHAGPPTDDQMAMGEGQVTLPEPEHAPEPAAASGGAMEGGGKKGGENSDAVLGREKHAEFSEKAKAKGWETEPRLTDPKTGKQVKPDAVTKSGHPVEYKPRTPSGKAAGRRQLKKYERATGKKGRVIYYDKKK